MNVARINKMDISNGKGIGVALFTSGCSLKCKGCHNYTAWDFNAGERFTRDTRDDILALLQPSYISRFSILGGEPLEEQNLTELYKLVKDVRDIYGDERKIWLYTGRTIKNIWTDRFGPNAIITGTHDWPMEKQWKAMEIIGLCDVVVDGPYIESQRDVTLLFKGSRNQRLIDVRKSFDKGTVVEFEL